MTARTDATTSPSAPKPKFALFVATAAGLGYFPKAPGTLGSLGGLVFAAAPCYIAAALASRGCGCGATDFIAHHPAIDVIRLIQIALTLAIGAIGVWSASQSARYWALKDPQRVVIDEVSGQHITLLLGCALPAFFRARGHSLLAPLGMSSFNSPLNWKYLLVGFILFRLFDIWKPFPARQAEALPSGLGIMADDWAAGLYAGIGLWLARCAGL